jgi:hypothetical protein
MNEPPNQQRVLETQGELAFRFVGMLLIVFGVFNEFVAAVDDQPAAISTFGLFMLGVSSMIYSRLCQIARFLAESR